MRLTRDDLRQAQQNTCRAITVAINNNNIIQRWLLTLEMIKDDEIRPCKLLKEDETLLATSGVFFLFLVTNIQMQM